MPHALRECVLCPPWVECAHYGDQCVRLYDELAFRAHMTDCAICRTPLLTMFSVNGPGVLRGSYPCNPRWGLLYDVDREYPTEAEARAEFERRVALMLEAE